MDEIRLAVLRGQTVTLRSLAATDAVAIATAASESRQQFAYIRVPAGVEEAQRYIEAALADRAAGRRLPLAIVWQDRVVGSTSYLDLQRWRWPAGSALQRTDHPDAVEIGSTWLAASAQRTRCNTEAKYLLLSHAAAPTCRLRMVPFGIRHTTQSCGPSGPMCARSLKALAR